jgi:hypothetical protein
MQIIIHRVNLISNLLKIPKKYGVEVDVRAYGDKLILNHEPHKSGDELEEYLQNCNHAFIIFNIKEDGIEEEVIELAEKYGVKDYFLLDVEYPFIYRSISKGFKKIGVRFSEAEPIESALAQKVNWVWVDTNTKFPLNEVSYKKLKHAGFKICLVCPERWGRSQDIENYKEYMKENQIKIDAVMTSLKYAEKWSS